MIRVGTQNMGMDEAWRAMSVVGSIFASHRLDIFALQEVYRWPKQGEGDLVGVLRAGFGGTQMFYHEGPLSTWMVNMTVSRWPIVQEHTIHIEDRHLLDTLVATPSGHVRIFNWHAKRDAGGKSNACRYNRQAFDYMRDVLRPGDAAFMVGDLNAKTSKVMSCGGEGLLRSNPAGYEYSDFFAYVHAPSVLAVEAMGNEYNLLDAHILTVATVTTGRVHKAYMPLIMGRA